MVVFDVKFYLVITYNINKSDVQCEVTGNSTIQGGPERTQHLQSLTAKKSGTKVR